MLYIWVLLTILIYCSATPSDYKWPTVGISVLIRNKEHTLPYFFSCLEKQDYPKDRIYIWIYTDHNEDKSIDVIDKWSTRYSSQYNRVYITSDNTSGPLHYDEAMSTHWSPGHFRNVIKLREKALNFARKSWADYIFMVDADVFLTNPSTLRHLVSKDVTYLAPMLLSEGLYSNFWCGMTENYYYKRTDDYKPILNRDNKGCFEVPMIHTAVLISLHYQASDYLSYDPNKIERYDGPEDDIIAFALTAERNGLKLHICNDNLYGFVPVPLEDQADLADDYDHLVNIKLTALSRGISIPLDPYLEEFVKYPNKWKFLCDEIYMINLERRTERRRLMELSFKELGMSVNLFTAVDGRNLDMQDLREYSITIMPNYEDPYHRRPMKAGEVGCFLSHYYVWEEIVEKGHGITLVLEDDIHFQPFFKDYFLRLMDEINDQEWDLVYIGRKVLQDSDEEFVTEHTTRPLYSYWTLGYLLSQRGARKLLDAQPLSKLLPVDEFLPIMFNQHPNKTWLNLFPKRNLIALSANPLLISPTHYSGEEGYISDTEDSNIIELLAVADNRIKNEL